MRAMRVSVRFDTSKRQPLLRRPRWHQWLTRGHAVKTDSLAILSEPSAACLDVTGKPASRNPESSTVRDAQNCIFEVF